MGIHDMFLWRNTKNSNTFYLNKKNVVAGAMLIWVYTVHICYRSFSGQNCLYRCISFVFCLIFV